jgi:predicted metal-dependent HD superfamily phosphohydrolase
MFNALFTDTILKLRADEALSERLWKDITLHYSSPSRHYHNLTHLNNLGLELIGVGELIEEWDLVVLATAYHDIVYDTLRQDNEEASAAYASSMLSKLLPANNMAKVTDLILATKGHNNSPDLDTNYFVDADLAILGSPMERYQVYLKEIRSEYAQYPDAVYRPGRTKVMQHFLEMREIFKTPVFYNKYEERARENIIMEIESLRDT